MSGYAFAHALRQRPDAFTAAGRLTKNAWLGITGASALFLLLIPLFGLLAEPHVLRARAVVPGAAQQHDAVLAGRAGRDAGLPGRRPARGRRGAAGGLSAGDRPGPSSARCAPSPPSTVPTCSPIPSSPPSRPSTRRTPPRVGVAEIDPALADTAAFCAAYGSPMDGLGELRGGRRPPRRRRPVRGVPGARDHPRRRQRPRAAPAGRAQGVVRADGRRGGADRHGVRRDHPARPARRLAAAGGRRGGGRAGGGGGQRAAGLQARPARGARWRRCRGRRSSRGWPARPERPRPRPAGVRRERTLVNAGMPSTV